MKLRESLLRIENMGCSSREIKSDGFSFYWDLGLLLNRGDPSKLVIRIRNVIIESIQGSTLALLVRLLGWKLTSPC